MKRARLLLFCWLFGCPEGRETGETAQTQTQAPSAQNVQLGDGVIASVGKEVIGGTLVQATAEKLHVSPKVAIEPLIDDALAAEEAVKRGMESLPPVRASMRSALAKTVVSSEKEQAERLGPPTRKEIDELNALHWREVNSPPPMLVAHLVVLKRGKLPGFGVDEAEGVKLATKLREDLVSVSDREFEDRAKALAGAAFGRDVRVERLPRFVEDGRPFEGSEGFDPLFAKGAAAIQQVGGTSPIVESPYGWHVIRLLERQPARFVPDDARAKLFYPEIVGSSRVDLQACKLEYSIVSPK